MEYNLTKIFNFFLKYGLILSLTIGLYLFLNWRRRRWEKGWQDIWQKPFGRNGDTGIYLSWPSESLRRLFYMGTDFQITAMDLILMVYSICAALFCYVYIIRHLICKKNADFVLITSFWTVGLVLSLDIARLWELIYFMRRTKVVNRELILYTLTLTVITLLTAVCEGIIILEVFGVLA